MLRVIDLFSGAGGMSLGLVDPRFCGGFQSVLAIDNDSAAVETHQANFSGKSVCANIEDWILKNDIPEAEVVIGGPPCQGFSLLNKKRDGDQRRALWEPFIEVTHRSGASIFLMENVAELFRSPELQDIRSRAAECGFETDATIVNTADYGAPQKRRRTIVLGWKSNVQKPQFPPLPTHAAPDGESNLPKWKTVRDAISDLPPPTRTNIEGDAPLDLHIKRNPTDKSIARYKAVPPGGNRFDLQKNAPELTPNCWLKKKNGGTDLFGRLWWERPSVTIRTEFFKPEKGRYLHPEQNRPITHREAARLMGFPDDFKFKGSKIEIARQIGNAVPPALAGSLGQIVLETLQPLKKSAQKQMARRSKATSNFEQQVSGVKQLLDEFLVLLDSGDLRKQVVSLIPAVHGLRDLGSGLVDGVNIASARDRILAYLRKYPKTLIDGDELMVVAGIGEWARRVRELRVQYGWTIYTGATLEDVVQDDPNVLDELSEILGVEQVHLRPDQYILMNPEQDREAALRWNQLNSIRNRPGGVKAKLLEYLRLNVGHVITGEELRYLAKDNKEWARRSRELRTEDGWPIVTRMQGRLDLAVGEYLLEEDRQAEEHDRRISDALRVKVLKRDGFACTDCGWKREKINPDDPRKFLELHHLEEHSKGGANSEENLITLCNVHHDEVHAGRLKWHLDKWIEVKQEEKWYFVFRYFGLG